MKKRIAALLAALLLLSCSGCGQSSVGAFRVLKVVGTNHYSVICRKDDKIAPYINAAMEQLAAGGNLSAISLQWLGTDTITLEGDSEALSALERPEDGRTLIVGVATEFNPMAFTRGGEYVGMSVDIGTAVGMMLGWPVVFQPIAVSDIGAQLSSGNIDCAIGFEPSLVNAAKYDVGVTYMSSDIVLAVREDSEVKRLKQISGQRIGTIEDAAVQAALKADEKVTKYASGATVYLSVPRCVDALDKGWCAAVAMDRLHLLFLAQA